MHFTTSVLLAITWISSTAATSSSAYRGPSSIDALRTALTGLGFGNATAEAAPQNSFAETGISNSSSRCGETVRISVVSKPFKLNLMIDLVQRPRPYFTRSC